MKLSTVLLGLVAGKFDRNTDRQKRRFQRRPRLQHTQGVMHHVIMEENSSANFVESHADKPDAHRSVQHNIWLF